MDGIATTTVSQWFIYEKKLSKRDYGNGAMWHTVHHSKFHALIQRTIITVFQMHGQSSNSA